jgi:uncharacterized protein YkwD
MGDPWRSRQDTLLFMQRLPSAHRSLEIALVSVACLGSACGLWGCSGTENSDPKGTAAGSSAGGSTNSTAGASTANAGAMSGGSATVGGQSSSSGGASGNPSGGSSSGGSGSGGASGSSNGGGPGGSGSNSGGAAAGDRSPDATCARWKADTANVGEGTWSGSVDTCMAGDISADGRENALRLFNLVRWLADLPAVVTEDARNQQAQACALMMTANKALSHDPPADWKCFTELGKKGASTSNISGGPGVSSVLSYMVDDGNLTTFGHRRIILANDLGPIGLGSAGKGGSSCMQNIGGTGKATKAWTAWPPPGAFPLQAYTDTYKRSLDATGWSIQSKSINLTTAQVTVTSGGQSLPVKVEQLAKGYGNADAIRIVLDGWKAAAGATYAVSVSGTATPIAYEFQLVDCK